MKKVIVLIMAIGILFIAGCPDGAYLGAMYLKANAGPIEIDEVIPMFGAIWLFDKENNPAPREELREGRF